MPNNFFITTPIYYVNDIPHIGHAYTSIATDFIARFKRMSGVNTIFLTGTDEHGQKIQKAAENNNWVLVSIFINPAKFRELTEALNLSNDDFIRTTEKRHIDGAKSLWNRLKVNSGDIYLDTYKWLVLCLLMKLFITRKI